MIDFIGAFAENCRHHWEWLLSASLKVTVWLLLTAVTLRLLRSASASFRHAVAVLAALGVAAIFAINLSPIPEQFGWRPLASILPAFSAGTSDDTGRSAVILSAEASNAAPRDLVNSRSGKTLMAVPPDGSRWGIELLGVLVVLWSLGCTVVAWRLLRRLRKFSHFSADREPLVEAPDELSAMAQREAARLNLKPARVPRLSLADHAMPMLIGLRTPAIVLPTEASDWPHHRIVSVLRHELLHVRRRDLWWVLIVEVALIPAWWHPLARTLKKQFAELTEQACDDAVIVAGTAPAEYANDLLSLSRRLLPIHSSALAMPALSGSESSQLGRFRRVLDENACRHALSPMRLMTIAGLALALLIPGTLLISCDTTEPVGVSKTAERQASSGAEAEAEPTLASASHPPIEGVPADAKQLVFSIKMFEVDIDDDPRFAQEDIVEWMEGKRQFLTPDEGFRLFHPQRKGMDLLTAPKIFTRPGEAARLEMGQRIPYIVSKADSDEKGAGGIAVTGEDEERNLDDPITGQLPPGVDSVMAGILMTVEATTTSDPNVLQVDFEASVSEHIGFIEEENGNQIPEMRTQLLSFNRRFPNGSYVCVGEKTDVQSIEDKVPLLGDIPLIGTLFREQETLHVRRLLVVQVIVSESEQ